MAGHGDISHIQGYDTVIFLDQFIDLHHSVTVQQERVMAAHESAAGADLEFHQMKMQILQIMLQRLINDWS